MQLRARGFQLSFDTSPKVDICTFDDLAEIFVNFGIGNFSAEVLLYIFRSGKFKHVGVVIHIAQFLGSVSRGMGIAGKQLLVCFDS